MMFNFKADYIYFLTEEPQELYSVNFSDNTYSKAHYVKKESAFNIVGYSKWKNKKHSKLLELELIVLK